MNIVARMIRRCKCYIKCYLALVVAERITGVTTVVRKVYSDMVVINAPKKHIIRALRVAARLKYDPTPARALQSFINGTVMLTNNLSRKKLCILMLGYEYDTYDAQFLLRLGYYVNIYYMDLNSFNNNKFGEILRNRQASFTYIQDDIRNVSQHFSEPQFDYIFTSRACLDGLDWRDAIAILQQSVGLLRDEYSCIVTHLLTVYLDQNRLMAIDNAVSVADQRIVFLPMGDEFKGIDWFQMGCDFLRSYSSTILSRWFNSILCMRRAHEFVEAVSLQNDKANGRLLSCKELPGRAELFATYHHMTPHISKRACYIANIVVIRK